MMVEPGQLCLGLLDQGSFVRLRSLRIDAHWATDLWNILERETCLAELDEMPGDAYLWLRPGLAPSAPLSLPLRLHLLQDQCPSDPADAVGHMAAVGS
jgi:hypothetical protein